jgi:hypothetical protein
MMPRWSLHGIRDRVIEKSLEWINRTKQMEQEFHSKFVMDFADLLMLCHFPYLVQQLILKELHMLKDKEDGDLVPLNNIDNDISYICLFY